MTSEGMFGAANQPESAPAAGEQGPRNPEQIERESEDSREELGETVSALAARADIKTQARQRVAEVRQRVTAKKSERGGKAQEAAPPAAGEAVFQAAARARESPVPVAVGAAVAAGFVLGWLIGRRKARP